MFGIRLRIWIVCAAALGLGAALLWANRPAPEPAPASAAKAPFSGVAPRVAAEAARRHAAGAARRDAPELAGAGAPELGPQRSALGAAAATGSAPAAGEEAVLVEDRVAEEELEVAEGEPSRGLTAQAGPGGTQPLDEADEAEAEAPPPERTGGRRRLGGPGARARR